MKNHRNRVGSVLIVGILLLSFISAAWAGGAKETPSAKTATPAAGATTQQAAADQNKPVAWKADPPDLEWKQDTSPITLKIYFGNPAPAQGWLWGTTKISKEITRRTGVTVDATFDPEGNNTKLQLMMASSEKLPDFLSISRSGAVWANLMKGNYIASISDLMDQYAPKMRDVILKGEEQISGVNGKLWGLDMNAYGLDQPNEKILAWWGCFAIRDKKYKELGSPKLETTVDFLNVLKAAKQKFPEIRYPLYMPSPTIAYPFYISFGGKCSSVAGGNLDLTYNSKQDKVMFWFEDQDIGLKAIKYINSLYREGVLLPETFTWSATPDKSTSEFNQGHIFSFALNNVWAMSIYNPVLQKADPADFYTGIEPVVAPGAKWTSLLNLSPNTGYGPAVTKDSINAKRAIRYLEFLASNEGQSLLMFGIEGEDYDLVKDGDLYFPRYKGEALSLVDSPDLLYKMGINNHNYNWLNVAFFQFVQLKGVLLQKTDEAGKRQTANLYRYLQDKYTNTTTKAMAANASTVSADSAAGRAKTKIDEFVGNQLVKVYVADTDDQLNKEYKNLLDGLQKLDVEVWRVDATKLAKDYIKMMEDGGKKWTD